MRKEEVEDMAAPVQIDPLENHVKIDSTTVRPDVRSQWIFSRNRTLGPAVISAFLILFYFVSPYLPKAILDFLGSLR